MESSEERKRLECVVHGKVQGVFYRDTIRQKALLLGLAGFVKNVLDGTVFAVAEGEENALGEFLAFLYEGSPGSKVEDIQVEWKNAEGNFKDFEIG